MRLIPREGTFYRDFQALGERLHGGARLLEEMLAPAHPIRDKAEEIKVAEHECDFITRDIFTRLNQTFVTPLDREDIHALARSLDDCMDAIDAAATLVHLYGFACVRYGARELAQIITQAVAEINRGLHALERGQGFIPHGVEINRLEKEADRLHQEAVRRLFAEEGDPMAVFKWKEALDLLEDATDRCEDAANVIETILLKHG